MRCVLGVAQVLMVVVIVSKLSVSDAFNPNDDDKFNFLNDLLRGFDKAPESASTKFESRHLPRSKAPRIPKFSWKNCGSASFPSHIDDVSLMPDPLKLPGNVSLGFQGGITVNLSAPLKMDVEVKKKMIFWITVPCIDHFGSCTYDDVCQLIPLLKCPEVFKKYGIPCQCPIAAGDYKLPPSLFYVDDSFLPAFLTDGSYQVTATISDSKQQIVCIHLEFSIA